ncbi:phospholipase A2-like [Paramuricea clavata]|uniref:Phospholipase A2-like n=1 Tax=Paramuricea clavata TaxID=317549 RepID=A0A6S7G859_PARCT|nr:phospholipase A2-like [Paramuricea clavata]
MIFQIRIRYLLIVTVIATLVKAYKLNCSSGSASSESLNETKEGLNNIEDLNITETWTWLPFNSSDPENVTTLWDETIRTHQKDEQGMNWCMHVGTRFEKMNFSRFQLTNKCCKEHFKSELLEINDDLRYKCADENDFFNCLKQVNTKMSQSIGDYYFNKVPPPTCYKVEENDYCYRSLCGSAILKISTDASLPVF